MDIATCSATDDQTDWDRAFAEEEKTETEKPCRQAPCGATVSRQDLKHLVLKDAGQLGSDLVADVAPNLVPLGDLLVMARDRGDIERVACPYATVHSLEVVESDIFGGGPAGPKKDNMAEPDVLNVRAFDMGGMTRDRVGPNNLPGRQIAQKDRKSVV